MRVNLTSIRVGIAIVLTVVFTTSAFFLIKGKAEIQEEFKPLTTSAENFYLLADHLKMEELQPLDFFLNLTAWIPNSFGLDVPKVGYPAKDILASMVAGCGLRDILTEQYAEYLGLPHRRVNFFNIPVTVGHSASEILINGKWRFFDTTFGIYFTKEGTTEPLSIAEARRLYPRIDVKSFDGTLRHKPKFSPEQSFKYKTLTFNKKGGTLGDNFVYYPGTDRLLMDIKRTYFSSVTSDPDAEIVHMPLVIDLNQSAVGKIGTVNASVDDFYDFRQNGNRYIPIYFVGYGSLDETHYGLKLNFITNKSRKIDLTIFGVKNDYSDLAVDIDRYAYDSVKVPELHNFGYIKSGTGHKISFIATGPITSVFVSAPKGQKIAIDSIEWRFSEPVNNL